CLGEGVPGAHRDHRARARRHPAVAAFGSEAVRLPGAGQARRFPPTRCTRLAGLMSFRNLTLFRFPTSLDLSDFDSHLAECALKPVGPLELASRGFVPPIPPKGEGDDGEVALSHRIGDAIWLSVGSEERLLPSAVVNDLLQ